MNEIGPHESGVDSDPVSEFYTRHPYPPPVDNLDRARDEWRDANRLRAEFHLVWPERPYAATQDILVAGCGTWQAARYALCRPDARVVGIDVSDTSVAHTQRLKAQYDLSNLEIRRLAIERAGELDREFDLVVCTGVLHHLADPDAGLRALRDVLRRHGVIYLMVYAPYGRAGVYMLQAYCRTLGIGASDREIADLRSTLESLPPTHPLVPLLRGSRDAVSPDALADALLNPRDRSYSVPQLFELLDRNGMRFERWYWQAPYLAHCGGFAATPHAPRLSALPPREQYTAMELWRGTMTAHSVLVRRDEATVERTVRFDDDRWPGFVPVRLPWTHLIEDRLPAGASGVLVNRSHPYPDLVLVLGAEERRLFDHIDGGRTIAGIVDRASVDRHEARAFFEKLWSYDQVVFDTSPPSRPNPYGTVTSR